MEKQFKGQEQVQKMRDDLRLKSHLFNMEIKDLWEEVEKKGQKFSNETGQAKAAVEDASKDVGAASELLLDEIRDGYEKIKNTLAV